MRRLCLAGVLLGLLPLVAGCWDFRGLDQRAFAVMVGVDRRPDNRFRVTAQFQLGRDGRGGGQGAGGGQGGMAQFRILTGEATSIREALEQIRADLVRELDMTFLGTIVIGREAAANLEDLLYFARSERVPITSFVAVARGTAEEVVRANSPGVNIPAEFTQYGFSGAWTRSPAVVRIFNWEIFHRDYFLPLQDPVTPALTANEYGLNWNGLAAFRGNRLAGFLDEEDAAVFSLLRGNRFQRSIATAVPGREGARAAIIITRGRTLHGVTWGPEGPVLHIRVSVSGDLVELVGMALDDPAAQSQVQAALAQELAGEIRRVVGRLQRLQSDPIGFGELARRAAPHRPEVQDTQSWHAAYQQARLEVTVRVKIISTGFLE